MDEEAQRAVADLLEIPERENNTPYQVYGMSLVNVLKWNIVQSYRKLTWTLVSICLVKRREPNTAAAAAAVRRPATVVIDMLSTSCMTAHTHSHTAATWRKVAGLPSTTYIPPPVVSPRLRSGSSDLHHVHYPLSTLISSLSYHLYADDTQFFSPFTH